MQQTKWFYNFLDETFTASWDGQPWSFKPKAKMLLQDYLANHFCKHLVDLALHRAGKQVSDHTRPELEAKCLIADGLEYGSAVEAEAGTLNANTEPVVEKKKVGRPKKEVQPEAEAEVFEGLEK